MRRSKRLASGLLVSLVFSLSPPHTASAAPGDLDPTFGAGGKVITDFGGGDIANALALQPDGKIIVAGESWVFPPTGSGPRPSFALIRYNADGSLDPTFGSGGKVATGFTGDWGRAFALALQPDAKIIAAGLSSAPGPSSEDFALARYNPDGALDPAFGSSGTVITNITTFGSFGSTDRALVIALQPDGKIVGAGSASGSDGGDLFALVRYNPDGSLDSSFGSGGKVTTDFIAGSVSEEVIHALAIQPDGKIVAAGRLRFFSEVGEREHFALARYNPDGSLDVTFGDGGKVTTDFGGVAGAFAVALQPDGKIVAGGAFTPVPIVFPPAFALVRYNPDGSFDTSFGDGGKVITNFGGPVCGDTTCLSDGVRALSLQPDGKIIAGGRVFTGFIGCCDPTGNFAIARYHPDGSLDLTFGVGGMATTDFGGDDVGNALVLQPDGKIVLAGGPHNFLLLTGDFLLARYRGDPTLFVALTLNDVTFMPGDPLEIGTREANSGPDTYVDKYLGALLSPEVGPAFGCPGFDAVVFVTETLGLVLTCLSAPPDSFPPFATNVLIPADLPLTITDNIFSVTWPVGAPGGVHTIFMADIAAGSVADGSLDPGDLLAVGAAAVSATP